MFYVWGSGGDRAVAGSAGSRVCPICNSPQPFDLVVDYRYFHFWYLLSWVTSRKYAVVCARCGNGGSIDRAEARQMSQKDPIPFLRRRGWLIPAVILAPAFAWGFVSAGHHDQEVNAMLAAPQVGDVYSVDLGLVADSMKGQSPAYGDMRIVSVRDGKLQFVVASHAWDRKSNLRKEERKGAVYEDEYYDEDDLVELDAGKIEGLRADGTLFDVHRKP